MARDKTTKTVVESDNTDVKLDSADVQVENIVGGNKFPCVKHVRNNTPKTAFFTAYKDVNGKPVILSGNIQGDDSKPNKTMVEFETLDQLNGFIADCEAYEQANEYVNAIVISDDDALKPTDEKE